ncbi:MAG TPA: hypothetical protein VM573_03660 [Actinomycetota bacterium]|jgi:hypothetical protein|nr:hypothetical protein [Actinomycetota bacterium]
MTSAQLVLVSVTSAMVAVLVMLLVATIKRARARDDDLDERDGAREKDR